ncbi:MAG TPA: endonuclease, partial [Rikenellaceae bacterium]|nr:endonuclease [Rikenellaceae bacterium]
MKGRGEFGRRGEDEACMYLVSQGHTILERNWRCGHLEIDVITLA